MKSENVPSLSRAASVARGLSTNGGRVQVRTPADSAVRISARPQARITIPAMKGNSVPPIELPAQPRATRFASRGGAAYWKKVHRNVRSHFAGAVDLGTFIASTGSLTADERNVIVEQALIFIDQNYAHLPLKRAMHSIDPVQRLKLLQRTLQSTPAAAQPSDSEFHREMTDIFTSLRDLHTNYLLPAPFSAMTATLPFAVEDYFAAGQRRYLVSHIAPGFSHPTFVAGVEVTHWNGMPIERAAWNNGQRFAGSNREARHARGVETLTTRALRIAPPPDEHWVMVGYLTPAGQPAELRFDWQVTPPPPATGDNGNGSAAAALGLDLEQDIVRRMRLALFAPHVLGRGKKPAARSSRAGDIATPLSRIFSAREVNTPSGKFGYLRIWSFNHWPPGEFVTEFIRLLSALPQNGLIIDVRGNGGGVIMNGELILQTLTARRIEPAPTQFINSPLNLKICQHHGAGSAWEDLSRWVDSMNQALRTGSVFSAGFPITSADECNAIGQKYFGPVVLVTDALCYSTTDIFAAGFQDHDIGPIIGTDGNTGAGGANVWDHSYFVSDVLPDSVYRDLPKGAGLRVAIRRTLRVGRQAGTPLEDLGVEPPIRHFLTRNDLLNGNADLVNAAGARLAAAPARSLKVTVQSPTAAQATLLAVAAGIDRLDLYQDDRPVESLAVAAGQATFTVHRNGGASLVELRGYQDNQLVARYRTSVA